MSIPGQCSCLARLDGKVDEWCDLHGGNVGSDVVCEAPLVSCAVCGEPCTFISGHEVQVCGPCVLSMVCP